MSSLLKGDRVLLRPLRPEDAPLQFRWYADPEVTRYLPLAGQGSLPLPEIEAYIRQVMAADRPVLAFGIDLLDGRTIGTCSLRDFDDAGRAEVSLIIGEGWARGQGYGREAMALLLRHGFADLRLHCIWLRVREDNVAAIRLYRGLGFRYDGVMRASARVDGRYYDKWVMSLTAPEWAAGQTRSN